MTLYQGRIAADHRGLMDAINRSLPVDIRLLPMDLLTNRAWAGELRRLQILSEVEYEAVLAALEDIRAMFEAGAFAKLPPDEDVHTLVERLATEKAGAAGAKIHTGRSRNDQVVCDLRLWTLAWLKEIVRDLAVLLDLLRKLGEQHAADVLPGETHLQPAQPITLGHFLLSFAFALGRDADRFRDARARVDRCPLGAGALGGSGFPVDRAALAAALGFAGPCANALDAVSDRDFVQEVVGACAMLCSHLSRYAEQFVIWANPAFGFVRFSDAWSTGSSMMPQKRNPDAMELIRAKAARCLGLNAAALALTKGLPLAYAKDLQEDKVLLFNATDTASLCVCVFTGALDSARFETGRMKQALSGDLLATDLADALTQAGAPFRRSHEMVAAWVTELEKAGRSLGEIAPHEVAARFPELRDAAFAFRPADAVARRDVLGGTAPARVREQAEALALLLKKLVSD